MIYDYFGAPKEWDLAMIWWRQTILGFIIGLFEKKDELTFSEIKAEIFPFKDSIRKRLGRKVLNNKYNVRHLELISLRWVILKNRWSALCMQALSLRKYGEMLGRLM